MKPRIGVSACLLGEAVRYDGTAKPNQWILKVLSGRAELVPLCPEVGAGLGVPRPPVHLVQVGNDIRALGVEDPALDVTVPLRSWSMEMSPVLSTLDAVILKSRSPSCGVGSAPLHTPGGEPLGMTSGLFARYLSESFPGLLVLDDQLLEEGGRERLCRSLGIRDS